jgi:hypothetical protein
MVVMVVLVVILTVIVVVVVVFLFYSSFTCCLDRLMVKTLINKHHNTQTILLFQLVSFLFETTSVRSNKFKSVRKKRLHLQARSVRVLRAASPVRDEVVLRRLHGQLCSTSPFIYQDVTVL